MLDADNDEKKRSSAAPSYKRSVGYQRMGHRQGRGHAPRFFAR